MRLVTTSLIFALGTAVLVSTGCSPDARLRAQQRQSRERIEGLETDLQEQRNDNETLASELSEQQKHLAEIQKESTIQKKKFEELVAEFDALAERAAQAGALSEEMSAALADLAQDNSELLTYDSTKGLVRLESDLTFDLASDAVKSGAEPVLAALANICSADRFGDYQVIIVGHTDDVPIVHSETRAKHPTNWHLSVHRAIAVMNVLSKRMPEEHLAVMGFGQWRPMAPNLPGRQGNPLNRRVEIFIVPREATVPSAGIK